MANERRLTEGWTLSDGLIEPVALDGPCDVASALAEYGALSDMWIGANCLSCEWIQARVWTYSFPFEAEEGEDERLYLRFSRLLGGCDLRVNGESVGRAGAGEAAFDVTAAARAGRNTAELTFAPALWTRPERDRPVPLIGVDGPVVLRGASYITIAGARASANDSGLVTVALSIEAHTGGKYHFAYALSDDDGSVASKEFDERLRACRNAVTHSFECEDWREGEAYDLALSVTRAGVGCDGARFKVYFGPKPRKVAEIEGAPGQDMIDELRDLGADGVSAPDFERGSVSSNCLFDMPEGGAARAIEPGWALVLESRAKELAGGEAYWPAKGRIWRLRGAVNPPEAEKYSEAARRSRCEQAERLFESAAIARLAGETVAVARVNEEYPRLMSRALMEWDGAKRPAWYALKAVWAEEFCFAELPAEVMPGELIKIRLRLAVRKAAALRVCAYEMSGSPLAGATFAARGDVDFTVSLPEEASILIIRCELTDGRGRKLALIDRTLRAGDCQTPKARVTVRDGRAINEGTVAALCFASSGGYRALLPGEECECAGDRAEWLNK